MNDKIEVDLQKQSYFGMRKQHGFKVNLKEEIPLTTRFNIQSSKS